jgi:hypothetical protein
MATTTNYGWAEPDNTSLVKNGAQDIRILGDAIDASVWNIGYGQAGKNKIINGDMGIWQRGTSITIPNNTVTYAQDRFYYYSTHSAGTATATRQTFTPGTAPVAGYEGSFFARMTCGSTTTYGEFAQRIEDVRTFAGQTVTLSYWAKASVTTTLSNNIIQVFGSGGSGNVTPAGITASTITTSWQRFTKQIPMASISGKTIGDGSNLWVVFSFTPTASQTIDIWGVQVEYGSKATPFQTASGGSPQAELAMCQRYYQQPTTGVYWNGQATSGVNFYVMVYFPVAMRAAPTVTTTSIVAGNFPATASTPAFVGTTSFANTRTASGTGAGGFADTYTASAEL